MSDAEKGRAQAGEARAETTGSAKLRRREFLRLGVGATGAAAAIGAGAAAGIGGLDALARAQANSVPASPKAQAAAETAHGTPWWAARPANGKVGKPEAIDLHSHWSPEP